MWKKKIIRKKLKTRGKTKKKVPKSRIDCSLLFKDAPEKVLVEEMYPEIVPKALNESVFESNLLVTFHNDLQVQETEEIEEEIIDENVIIEAETESNFPVEDYKPFVYQVGQNPVFLVDSENVSELNIGEEIVIGNHETKEIIPIYESETTKKLPLYPDNQDIHFDIPTEILQVQLYDFVQWMNSNQQRFESRKLCNKLLTKMKFQ